MLAFRISSTNLLALFSRPFLFCFFLYLLSTTIDCYHVQVFFAKIKIPHVIGLFFFLLSFALFRALHLPRNFTLLTFAIICSCLLSITNSLNPIACVSFMLFFIYSYLMFFVVPYNLFYYISAHSILQVYFNSFFVLGAYALCQVSFSCIGFILPGVSQFIFTMARGQAFFYEPSYYALYMTPFAVFYTTRYLLQSSSERRLSCLIWPNCLLLVSTSTGCFFSYLMFLFFLALFSSFRLIKIRFFRFFLRCFLVFGFAFACLWSINSQLITYGFLKFFYHGGGITAHASIQERWAGAMNALQIFYENMFIGVGLGSLPFSLAAKLFNGPVDLLDPEIPARYCATNVATEILASLGLVGTSLFIGFCYLLIRTFQNALRIPHLTPEEKRNLIAFALSICVLFVTLQFNQSIMRPYVWVHIGLFVGYAQSLKIRDFS